MDQPILYLAVGGLLIVFFLVLIYFFTRTWRWFHIVCVVLVFFASIFLARNAAAVYRTWNAWRSLVSKTTKQAEKLEEEHELLRYGKFDDTEQTVESTRLLNAKIGRVILDRGRVWWHCTPSGPPQADGTVTVSTVPPGMEVPPPVAPPAAPAAAPAAPAAAAAPGAAAPGAPAAGAPRAAPAAPAGPPPNRIQDQTVLYVFLEDVPPPEAGGPPGVKFPYYYIGDFVAVVATDTSVTLQPLTPLSRFDSSVIRDLNKTWALYDTMPVDGHEWFAADVEQKPNWNQPADVEPVFGKINESIIKAMFLQWPHLVPPMFANAAEMQDAMNRLNVHVEAYIRDGKTVPVANKDDFPPMHVWSKVTFKKNHKEVVDSGAKVSPFAAGVTDDFFDRGMAEVAILQLGREAEFKVGDVAIFPQEDAQQLINAEVCDFKEYVYVRPLNDYTYLFRNFTQQFDKVHDDTDRLIRDLAELKQAQANIGMQLALANDDKSKLTQDLAKTKEEGTKIAAYLATLEASLAETKAQLSLLYRTNLQLEEELDRLSQKTTDNADPRARRTIAER